MSRDVFTAVVNPAAGAGTAAARITAVARALREAGATVHVAYTRSLQHATELAAAAAEHTVLAVGGDGIAGAVAAGLLDTGAELAVVPAGRGNDLARAVVPLPADPAAAAQALLRTPSGLVDVAEAGGRVVAGSVCTGIDAVANDLANRRLPRRPAAYQLAALLVMLRWRPVRYTLTVDGVTASFTGHTVVVANAPWYGGGLRVAPHARLDDGLLDVVTVGPLPRSRMIGALAALRHGRHLGLPGITTRTVREITVAANRPLPVYADGEFLGTGPVTIRVRPAALRLIGAGGAG
ncbi:putative lipid kinase yegS-like protein [Actinoplanes sp. SE50]|uniref:diacylglycerol/lipid kinase family protein n=1 Tax=unclassified Actinoplanes TaxID=2626549 RepID=UPI00023EC484|nr:MULTISPECIES: diacylglycerol kinase family protein [unclassified Actinoplanes]AEV84655.1 putative lipid kinase yegS-like protein [Actinoplanes sp. SE50/110]ATO83047.1 putative lipid kinase yegS-like protein [Actinoplanes sp. SE50]SLM00455.1 lipid kinase yegS-like protein [Actinoplanes sp. SE50/110]